MDATEQNNELHKTIWKIAEDLRGSVDGWDFKQYVLGFLFYRFISENLAEYIKQLEGSNDDKFYEKLEDELAKSGKESIVEKKGFFISPSNLFSKVLENLNQQTDSISNLNEKLQDAFNEINNSCNGQASEESFKDLFKDIDLKSPKLGTTTLERNKTLAKIMNSIGSLCLKYQKSDIDAFGNAYEYLMAMYASSAGKSGGEFFTPQEVSKLLVKLTLNNQASPNKVYDPACGSGSLLLQYKKLLQKDPPLGYFGQEINITTYNLCRMNMFLHNVEYHLIHIAHGDTLISPSPYHREEEPFDAIVSNPPYSTKWEGKDNPLLINDYRFSKAGVLAPKSYADYAFIMHSLSWLSEKGSAAIVVFPGILYRGNAEATIRKYLINENYIDCIISLPENIFFGTSIATCIMILRKNKTDNNILFIDATNLFTKKTKKNVLEENHLDEILELYKNRETKQYCSYLATFDEIIKNDYILEAAKYIEKQDTKEQINIKTLNAEIKYIVEKQTNLRIQIDSIITQLECIED